ncbi:MAG: hypothetical protein J6Y66_01940 [Bacteroidales bacterium]|nr:hypothetical protein [Bacteroidales bacterium]
MAGVKYHYALDENNRLLSIKQAYLERQEGHTYHCIGCGAEMIARLGEVRNWHFSHRSGEAHCGTETYLHKLAKRRIKEKFDKGDSFKVGYYREVKCSDLSNCPFAINDTCKVHKLETFDLKSFYDTCQEEKEVEGYVADLLITNSQKPERGPVLIEVQVSHKSTAGKRLSGLRILEVRIREEEDIDKLLSAPIVENPDSRYVEVEDIKTIGYAKFYGFKKKSSTPEPLEMRSINRFYLFRSGKAFVSNMDEFKSCRKVYQKDNNNALFEASIDSFYLGDINPYEYGYFAARQNGFEVKTCQFCKYHRDGYAMALGLDPIFCCLYKKYGTPQTPEPQFAYQCAYYREDTVLLNEISKTMPTIVVATDPLNM